MEKLQEAYLIKTKMTATDFVMLILVIAYNFLRFYHQIERNSLLLLTIQKGRNSGVYASREF